MKKILLAILILALPILALCAEPAAVDPFADGLKLFNIGKYEASIERYQQAVKEKPDDAMIRLAYGVTLATIRRHDDAVTQFKEASRIAPDDPVAYFLLEGAYLAQNKSKEAAEVRRLADEKLQMSKGGVSIEITIGQASPEAAMNRVPDPPMPTPRASMLESAVAEHPDNAIAHNLLGNLYQIQGRLTESVAHYRTATELAPGWFKPWFNLGMANLGVSPAEAASDFERAIKIEPTNLQAQLWLGDAYVEQRDYSRAIEAYSKAATSKLLEPQARVRMGNVYIKQRKLDLAEQEFDKAAVLAPQDPLAATGRAEVYRQKKLPDMSAREFQRAAVQSNSAQKAIVVPKVADIYIRNGEYQKAIDELRSITTMDQMFQEPFRMMANAYQRGGMLPQGIVEYETTLNQSPHNTAAMRFLLSAYTLAGNQEKRAGMAQKLIKELPEESVLWNRELGLALIATGDRKGAIEAWRHALETDPGSGIPEIMESAKRSGCSSDLQAWYEKESSKPATEPSIILTGIYEWQGNYKGAADTMRRLTSRYPAEQVYWIFLGDDLVQAGDLKSAKAAYTHAAGMNENPTLKAIALQRLQDLK